MDEAKFLELLTGLAKIVKPVHRNTVTVADMDTQFKDAGLDSLDNLMLVIYACELHGIHEEVGRTCHPANARELWNFVQMHKTRDVTDINEALEQCK